MTTLSLSYPPSTNRLWRSVNGRAIKSAEYRAWLAEAGWMVREQRPAPIRGTYRMTLCAVRPDNRRRDLSNLLKATEDVLVSAGVIEDDHLAQSILLFWSEAPARKPGAITVHLEPAEQARAA